MRGVKKKCVEGRIKLEIQCVVHFNVDFVGKLNVQIINFLVERKIQSCGFLMLWTLSANLSW